MANFVDDSLYRPRIEGFHYDTFHSDQFLFPSCHFFCVVSGRMLYITRDSHDSYLLMTNFYPERKFWYTFDGKPIKPRMSRMGFYTLYSSPGLYSCIRAFHHYLKYFQYLLVNDWFDFEPLDEPTLF